mgnify:CR=1 FL=1|tara:strand:+ start:10656 stop:11030 length:375 start_codon:yes stop_codon:yes gene_type:complete
MEFNKKIQMALGQMFKDIELNKDATIHKVSLEKLPVTRRNMTNTIKKYNAMISEIISFRSKILNFGAEFKTIEGKMQVAQKKAIDLGLDDEVSKIESDIKFLDIINARVDTAYEAVEKAGKQKV